MEGLPFFKFFPAEWMAGNITLCGIAARGLFIDVVNFYWIRSCEITLGMLEKRFEHYKKELDELEINGVFFVKGAKKKVVIKFLNDQFAALSDEHKSKVKAGLKGAKARKAKLKQSCSSAKAQLKLKDKIRKEEIKIDKIKIDTKEGERTPKDQAQEILNHLNAVTCKDYKDLRIVIQGLAKGRRVEDFHNIIETKLQDEHFQKNPAFMNPTTLFADKYWDKYVNQRPEDFKTPGGVSKDLTDEELLDSMKLEGDKKNG